MTTTAPIPEISVQEPFRTDLPVRESIIELGYAVLRGVLDRDDVLELRRQLLEIAHDAGWLAAGSDPMDALPSASAPEQAENETTRPVWRRMQRIEALHALGHAPALLDAIAEVYGDEPFFRYPSTVHRLKFPDSPPTWAHADWSSLQGSPDALTAWVPLGDVEADAGSLATLAGSHRLGAYRSDWHRTDDPDIRWHGGEFRAGDVLLFHVLTVHASLPNRAGGIRVSMDHRYQPLRDPVHRAWTVPHFGIGTWDEIAEGWTGPHAREWERLPLTVTDDREDDPEQLAGRCRPRLFELRAGARRDRAPRG